MAGLVLALGVLCSATSARADHLDVTLGSEGQLYTVKAGFYGDLFPASSSQSIGKSLPAATPVLALDTTVPGSALQRQLVPTSDDNAIESAPALIYEEGSKTLFVVWVSTNVNTVLKLASYDGKNWTDPITIISNQYASKTPPQLALTRDSHTEIDAASGKPVTHRRTVLHVVWSEDAASGLYQAYYAPVIFEDGAWIGDVIQPTHLNDFDAAEQTAQAAKAAHSYTPLVYTPAVQAGRDGSTVVAGFASETSGMLTAVEIDVLPEELRILADGCASVVTTAGAQYYPSKLGTLADQAQGFLLANGGAFQPEVLQAIVTGIRAQILAGAADVNQLAQKARGCIIDSGFKFSARGLRPFAPSSGVGAPPKVVEIVPASGPSHFLQVRVDSTRPSPPVGTTGVQIFLARTGLDVMAAWTSSTNTKAIFYTKTEVDGTWSQQLQLQLSPSLSLQQALQVLAQRIY